MDSAIPGKGGLIDISKLCKYKIDIDNDKGSNIAFISAELWYQDGLLIPRIGSVLATM